MQRLYEIGDWVRTNYCGGENVARINGYKWYIPRWSDNSRYRNDPHIIYLGSRLCGLNSGYPDFRGDWMWSGKYKQPSGNGPDPTTGTLAACLWVMVILVQSFVTLYFSPCKGTQWR